jgi:hypothetical protein
MAYVGQSDNQCFHIKLNQTLFDRHFRETETNLKLGYVHFHSGWSSIDRWRTDKPDGYAPIAEAGVRNSPKASFDLDVDFPCYQTTEANAPHQPLIWPLPRKWKNGTSMLMLSRANWKFNVVNATVPTLTAAFARFQNVVFAHSIDVHKQTNAALNKQISGLDISVGSIDESHPQLETDESYSLSIPADGSNAKVRAKTIYGAMHALETFSQLVSFDFDASCYKIEQAPWEIEDQPRFQHRGLLIDTARHFLPVVALKQLINSLTYAKLNVLHWVSVSEVNIPLFEYQRVCDLYCSTLRTHSLSLLSLCATPDSGRAPSANLSGTHSSMWQR